MSDLAERYDALKARAKAMGADVRVTVFSSPVSVGRTSTVVYSEPPDLSLEQAIATAEGYLYDQDFVEAVEREARINKLASEHFVRGVELFTLTNEHGRAAAKMIDKGIADENARHEAEATSELEPVGSEPESSGFPASSEAEAG